jgi:hypothetical protein
MCRCCAKHRGLTFFWKATLVTSALALPLFTSMFLPWSSDGCGPKYSTICQGASRSDMQFLFTLVLFTCLFLALVPVLGGACYDPLRQCRYLPNESCGIASYAMALGTLTTSLFYYIRSGVIVHDATIVTDAYGQCIYIATVIGAIGTPLLWLRFRCAERK